MPLLLAKEKLGFFMPSRRCVLWTLTPSPGLDIGFNSLRGLEFFFPAKRKGLVISRLGTVFLRSCFLVRA